MWEITTEIRVVKLSIADGTALQLYKESGIAAAFFANRAPSSTHRRRRGFLTYNPFFEAS